MGNSERNVPAVGTRDKSKALKIYNNFSCDPLLLSEGKDHKPTLAYQEYLPKNLLTFVNGQFNSLNIYKVFPFLYSDLSLA